MPYEFYKVLHLIGLISLFFGFGGVMVLAYAGHPIEGKAKKMAFILHGAGLAFILVSGFGMAARLGLVSGLPGWIHAKLTVWVLLGAAIVVAKKKGAIGWPLAVLLIGLGTTAAYIAINKPF